MAKKLLDDFTDPEIDEAGRRLADLDNTVQRDAAANPGPGWDFVFGIIERAQDEYAAEKARRKQG